MLEENIDAQILLLRYLLDGNAVMSSGKLISYHDLPWGRGILPSVSGQMHLPAGKKLRDPPFGVSQDHGKPAWSQKGDRRRGI